ncbi:toll/interleukin-1 receptor domain-containing protein [Treponema phagedenis]|uniref:toll/interleukin-1 receptor domain-containing protein n=1 Tax=Treponema phagedenis TaxID=162 RepID=UPI0015A4E177|nr:toll/interleukin-1 receptor domain-containing protein [Treponema phagedenis]NVP24303.1 toll/interleukin-1 receptor domain-containing protein [Treponema phagedenis]QLC59810.1 toll/interleukin-1 receptor domain-containing protein [Treponema phagedenis]
MVKAYRLDFNDYDVFDTNNYYYQEGEKLYKLMESKIDTNLKKNFFSNGELDGRKLSNHWFPQLRADVFISHSHKDSKSALKLAGYLYKELNLKCFIDSCVWEYSDKLLRAIDNRFCLNKDRKTYNYDLRNFSTSHVHMMLTVALTKMIYHTECLFFLNTPNSIFPHDTVKNKTLSPWIYTELSMIKYIDKKSASEHRIFQENFSKAQESLEIGYDVDDVLNNLPILNFRDIQEWGKQKFHSKFEALDYLYKSPGSYNQGGKIHG